MKLWSKKSQKLNQNESQAGYPKLKATTKSVNISQFFFCPGIHVICIGWIEGKLGKIVYTKYWTANRDCLLPPMLPVITDYIRNGKGDLPEKGLEFRSYTKCWNAGVRNLTKFI